MFPEWRNRMAGHLPTLNDTPRHRHGGLHSGGPQLRVPNSRNTDMCLHLKGGTECNVISWTNVPVLIS